MVELCSQEIWEACRASQELISAQISWASAAAKRSRTTEPEEPHSTKEEEILAALQESHAALLEALDFHENIRRLAVGRAEETDDST